jgi:hypothetical protein
MATLAQRISDLATRIATEFKSVKNKMSGNNSGDISTLNTTNKTSLLAAINEVNTAQAAKLSASEKGAANGVAPLGADSKVPSSYLPAYVDDVLEFANLAAFPATGETGKIYVALDTNRTYRWGGSSYTQIASGGSVDSVFGRSGVVVAVAGDYTATQVNNDSSVLGATVAAALNTLKGVSDVAVRYDAQVLTAPQQLQARTNIGAVASSDVGNTDEDFVTIFNAGL